MTLLGGAVHVFRGCVHVIEATSFCANGGLPQSATLANKGALYLENPSCPTQVNDSYFEGNQVPLDGGAVQVQSAVRGLLPLISNCIFHRNHAQRFGGALAITSVTGQLLVKDSIFDQNTACMGGGAASFVSTAQIALSRCELKGNSAVLQGCQDVGSAAWSMGHGGAIYHVRSSGSGV